MKHSESAVQFRPVPLDGDLLGHCVKSQFNSASPHILPLKVEGLDCRSRLSEVGTRRQGLKMGSWLVMISEAGWGVIYNIAHKYPSLLFRDSIIGNARNC